jgi:hypothetical protein
LFTPTYQLPDPEIHPKLAWDKGQDKDKKSRLQKQSLTTKKLHNALYASKKLKERIMVFWLATLAKTSTPTSEEEKSNCPG